jgi:chromate transport protein ChrA
MSDPVGDPAAPTKRDLVAYGLRLGAIGFGGPVALVGTCGAIGSSGGAGTPRKGTRGDRGPSPARRSFLGGAVVDVPTALIAVATLVVLLMAKKAPEPLVIVVAGLVGLAVRSALGG